MVSSDKTSSVITRSTPYDSLPQWLTVQDVSTYLNLPRTSAYALAKRLPNRRFGKHLRISKSHFQPTGGAL